ncbi:hypothetical protein TFLX_00699 [Thermoflexales bacterium]|nr:hypothetical protein TFLX_00699 [Thermoflexales bacterium]
MTEAVPDLSEFQARPQSFIVRIWREDLGPGQAEWRGLVQHVLSHEARYCRDWATLLAYLQEMLEADGQSSNSSISA